MMNLDNSIADMYFKGYIDREEAIMRSNSPAKMEKMLGPEDEVDAVQEPEEEEVEVEEVEAAVVDLE
ncbi:MAG: hypothetical protein ACYTGS_07925 [Planctomycetota bacterium]|jgi:hypothetical protein